MFYALTWLVSQWRLLVSLRYHQRRFRRLIKPYDCGFELAMYVNPKLQHHKDKIDEILGDEK